MALCVEWESSEAWGMIFAINQNSDNGLIKGGDASQVVEAKDDQCWRASVQDFDFHFHTRKMYFRLHYFSLFLPFRNFESNERKK